MILLGTVIVVLLPCGVLSIKCRSLENGGEDLDMDYAVQECVRKMSSNTSDSSKGPKTFPPNMNGPKRDHPGPPREHREDNNRNKGSRENQWQGPSRGNEQANKYQSWDSSGRRPNGNQNNRATEETDDDYDGYYMPPSRRRPSGKERPHTAGQQNQHDRDVVYNYNNRPMFQPNNNSNKGPTNRPQSEPNFLKDIEACTIFCIFQEMKLVDERGTLIKDAVMNKLTTQLRDREMRDFLQDTVDDCFEMIDDESRGKNRCNIHNNIRSNDDNCRAAKSLAMCLEERGKQICEDWDDPIKTINYNDKEIKKKEEKPNTEINKKPQGSAILGLKRGG